MIPDSLPAPLLEAQGILSQTLPRVLEQQLPPIIAAHRNTPIKLLFTTRVHAIAEELAREKILLVPAEGGLPAQFTWKASGPLFSVLRRLRLEFLRYLPPSDLETHGLLAIWPDVPVPSDRSPEMQAPPAPASPDESRTEPLPEALETPPARIIELEPFEDPAPIADGEPEPLHFETPAAGPEPVIETIAPTAPEPAATPAPAPRYVTHHPPITGRGSTPLPGNFYQDWFGFEHMPFNNTPDPHFFFPTTRHQEALSRLIYAISERKGFVMISGEIGSGKSTLCRTLLAQLPHEVKTALITHTHVDAAQLVRAIAEDLDLEVAGLEKYEIIQQINAYLIEQLAAGCIVCIIIDEAQNLTPAALEEVRMISNLETTQEKLVQLILLGQPELREKIDLPEMRQLRQRIAVQFHLEPLTSQETLDYIDHRLKVAAPANPPKFPRGAMHEVYLHTGGVPRLINTLCDNALLTAYTREQRLISRDIVREAARDLGLQPVVSGWAGFFKLW